MFGIADADSHLLAKSDLLAAAGVGGWVTSQMCFDPAASTSWIDRLASAGVELPIRVGVPGPIDRARLLSMGARLGVGTSLRYLRKNRGAARMLARRHDPSAFVEAVAAHPAARRIEALHAFTFNAVGETRAWHDTIDLRARSRPPR